MKYKCSICDSSVDLIDKFCPKCGSSFDSLRKNIIELRPRKYRLTKREINRLNSYNRGDLRIIVGNSIRLLKNNKVLFKIVPYSKYFILFSWELCDRGFSYLDSDHSRVRRNLISKYGILNNDGNVLIPRNTIFNFIKDCC